MVQPEVLDVLKKHGIQVFQFVHEDMFTVILKTEKLVSEALIKDLEYVWKGTVEVRNELLVRPPLEDRAENSYAVINQKMRAQNNELRNELAKYAALLKQQKEERPLSARAEVWTRAWCAVASANDCKNVTAPSSWANAALMAFDEFFPEYKKDTK